MKKCLIAMLMVVCFALPAVAGADYDACFNSIDSDYDGNMTKSEFLAAFPDGEEAVFVAADGDKDGVVSHEEWEDFKASKGFEEGEHHG